jgi:hypothetical protein
MLQANVGHKREGRSTNLLVCPHLITPAAASEDAHMASCMTRHMVPLGVLCVLLVPVNVFEDNQQALCIQASLALA